MDDFLNYRNTIQSVFITRHFLPRYNLPTATVRMLLFVHLKLNLIATRKFLKPANKRCNEIFWRRLSAKTSAALQRTVVQFSGKKTRCFCVVTVEPHFSAAKTISFIFYRLLHFRQRILTWHLHANMQRFVLINTTQICFLRNDFIKVDKDISRFLLSTVIRAL